ncbi:MAG TPA: TylF/MycF/NovP-related O-methyltransferase [Steroidobacteraceae bacterium]|nr:TylF/MycF/NovP-related O-methyltransferase [Steroidobacteraceae bacterium]
MKALLKRMVHRVIDGYFYSRAYDIELQRNLLAVAATARFIDRYAATAAALHGRDDVIRYAAELARAQPGLVCEFGVYRGGSINLLAECLPQRPIYGFDSFEGLPIPWRTGYLDGSFDTNGALPEVKPNVQLIKGWFADTLPGFLSEHSEPVALVHIDCDLYASTRTVLDALSERMREGTVLLFDEYFNYPGWQQHEHRAFREFARASGAQYAYVAYNAAHQQVVVKCTRSSP